MQLVFYPGYSSGVRARIITKKVRCRMQTSRQRVSAFCSGRMQNAEVWAACICILHSAAQAGCRMQNADRIWAANFPTGCRMQKSRQRVSALCILLHRQDAECRNLGSVYLHSAQAGCRMQNAARIWAANFPTGCRMQKSRQRVSALCILLHRQDAECRMQLEFGQPISHRMHRQDADCRNLWQPKSALWVSECRKPPAFRCKNCILGGVALDS